MRQGCEATSSIPPRGVAGEGDEEGNLPPHYKMYNCSGFRAVLVDIGATVLGFRQHTYIERWISVMLELMPMLI